MRRAAVTDTERTANLDHVVVVVVVVVVVAIQSRGSSSRPILLTPETARARRALFAVRSFVPLRRVVERARDVNDDDDRLTDPPDVNLPTTQEGERARDLSFIHSFSFGLDWISDRTDERRGYRGRHGRGATREG